MIIAIEVKTHATIAKYPDSDVKGSVVDVRAKGYSIVENEVLKDGNIIMWVKRRWNR